MFETCSSYTCIILIPVDVSTFQKFHEKWKSGNVDRRDTLYSKQPTVDPGQLFIPVNIKEYQADFYPLLSFYPKRYALSRRTVKRKYRDHIFFPFSFFLIHVRKSYGTNERISKLSLWRNMFAHTPLNSYHLLYLGWQQCSNNRDKTKQNKKETIIMLLGVGRYFHKGVR